MNGSRIPQRPPNLPFYAVQTPDQPSFVSSSWMIRRESLLELEKRRIFGCEASDGLALCEGMLRVVRGLFDGGVDYVDP